MRRLLAVAALAALAACAGQQPARDLARFSAAQIRSILVVPVLNRSVDVTAPDYFLSSVPVPIAERGYYVFPVNLVKRLLEDDGLVDPGLVHAADPARLASVFGADAVLYITIERWDAQWVLVNTQVTVAARYVLRDGHTGEELWGGTRTATYSSGGGGGGGGLGELVAQIVAAAVTKAAPNYMPLARQVNTQVVAFPGPGFPAGPYHPQYGQDWAPAGGTGVATAGGPPRAEPASLSTTTPATTPTATSTATSTAP